MNKIPISMIQLAHENGAEIQFKNMGEKNLWTGTHIPQSGILGGGSLYRIANKTADGLRLDELLEKAEWKVNGIEIFAGTYDLGGSFDNREWKMVE